MTSENIHLIDSHEVNDIVHQAGKEVFALSSYTIINGESQHDGYLLFKNPDKAIEIVRLCNKNIQEAQSNPSPNYNRPKKLAYYTPYKWVSVNDFFHSQVTSKGSFFTRNLDYCTSGIIQDNSLNEDTTHDIFQLNKETTSA